ncbi:MAG: hypothetical protein HZB77_11445, partial [Chloroflexi bacterium]|nr:hypothetical protein [Chloroflexota bacterium]
NRESEAARKIAAHFDPHEVYAATGNSEVVPMWTACKILWLKENEPDIFRRAFKFLLVEDFLLYRLSGRFATDGAIACSSLLWDARHGKWWDEMLAFLEITPERLAEPVLPGGIVGKVKRESAQLLGLSPNTLVIAGGVDLTAGAIGAASNYSYARSRFDEKVVGQRACRPRYVSLCCRVFYGRHGSPLVPRSIRSRRYCQSPRTRSRRLSIVG